MPTDIASLSMEFTTEGVKESQREMKGVEDQAKKTEKATSEVETATSKLDDSMREAADSMRKTSNEMRSSEGKISKTESATRELSREFELLKESLDPVYAAQNRHAESVRILDKELKAGRIGLKEYGKHMEVLDSRLKSSSSSFKANGSIAQQAGYQVGDFFVQVASGQSALVAFTQQGAQLAGTFGPGGAIIGAVLAIGGAIGGSLFKGLMNSKKATDELANSMERLNRVVTFNDGIAKFNDDLAKLANTNSKVAGGYIQAAEQQVKDARKSVSKAILDEFDKVVDTVGFSKLSDFMKSSRYTFKGYDDLLEDIASSLKLVGDESDKAAESILLGLQKTNTKQTAENFNALESAIIGVASSSGKTSEEMQRLVGVLGPLFDKSRELDGLLNALNEGFKSTAADDLIKKLKEQADTYKLNSYELIEYKRNQDLASEALKGATKLQIESVNAQYDRIYALEKEAESIKKVAAESKRLSDQAQKEGAAMKAITDRLDPENARRSQYQQDLRALNDNLISASMSGSTKQVEEAKKLIVLLQNEYEDAGEKAAAAFINPFQAAANQAASSLQNAIASGDWSNMGEAIGATLGTSISGVVNTSITEALSKGITKNSSLFNKIGAAFGGPIAGALVGGVVQNVVNSLFDKSVYDPTKDRQASQGTGTVLGSIDAKSESIRRAVEGSESGIGQLVGINQEMLRALSRTQEGITGVSTNLAFDLRGVKFQDNVGYLDLIDNGVEVIQGSLTDMLKETAIKAYASYEAGNKISVRLPKETENQFSLVFQSIYDSVEASAKALGIDATEALNNFTVDYQKISLEGLDAAAQQAEFEAYFSTVFDDIAETAVPFLEDFQRAGEGLGETLARLGNDTLVTQEAARQLGFTLGGLAGVDLIGASNSLADSLGGTEKLGSMTSSFVSRFASDARQYEIAQDEITRALDQANLSLPATRDGYLDLVQAQNLATVEGRKNIATLLKLQDSADKYYTFLEDSANDATSALNTIRGAINGLYSDSKLFQDMQQQQALNYLKGMAKSGVVQTGDRFNQAVQSVTRLDTSNYSTLNDFIRAQAEVGGVLSDLERITASGMTVEEKTLTAINDGNEGIINGLSQINQTLGGNSSNYTAPINRPQNSSKSIEIENLQKEMLMLQKQVAASTAKTANIMKRFELDGIEIKEI